MANNLELQKLQRSNGRPLYVFSSAYDTTILVDDSVTWTDMAMIRYAQIAACVSCACWAVATRRLIVPPLTALRVARVYQPKNIDISIHQMEQVCDWQPLGTRLDNKHRSAKVLTYCGQFTPFRANTFMDWWVDKMWVPLSVAVVQVGSVHQGFFGGPNLNRSEFGQTTWPVTRTLSDPGFGSKWVGSRVEPGWPSEPVTIIFCCTNGHVVNVIVINCTYIQCVNVHWSECTNMLYSWVKEWVATIIHTGHLGSSNQGTQAKT